MMRSDLVVLPEPSIDCDLSLFGGVEPFCAAAMVKTAMLLCGKYITHCKGWTIYAAIKRLVAQ